MLALGWTFFVLSSDYRKNQIDEFYYLNNLMKITYQDFLQMPVFLRRYLLDKWIEENKKNPSSKSKNTIEKKLGRWCVHLRKLYKNYKLTSNQISLLEKIIGWFWEKDRIGIWKDNLEKLKNYLKIYLMTHSIL